jgi:hypothetical protein
MQSTYYSHLHTAFQICLVLNLIIIVLDEYNFSCSLSYVPHGTNYFPWVYNTHNLFNFCASPPPPPSEV